MRRLAIMALALALAACDLTGPDFERADVTPLDPPPVYATWYAEVEDCLGQRGDLGAIRWFTATKLYLDGEPRGGVLRFPDEVTMRADHVTHVGAVKHEMIHHVTQIGDVLHGGSKMERCAVWVMP